MTSEITFEALPLAEPLQRALRERNYTTPSPIQAQAIPHLLEGRDMMGVAQTGTGKTAAFTLPILHQVGEDLFRLRKGDVRALILVPTRELAEQVAKSVEAYGAHYDLQSGAVYGGVGYGPQVRLLKGGLDVLVATPGRLLDLRERDLVRFDRVEHFVLDEADRMLDMGFIHDIRKVVAELPKKRQSLFFSATVSEQIAELAGTILRDPVEIRIAPKETTAERVDHRLCFVDKGDRFPLLHDLLKGEAAEEGKRLSLVFSRTKHGADKLAKQLAREGVKAEAIHGNKSQGARLRALERFRRGQVRVLVATDVAARGIDVKGISLVINFDLPDEPEAYVHRIGRTARAGERGTALTFCSPDRFKELRAVERLLKQDIETFRGHRFHRPDMEQRHRARAASEYSHEAGGEGRRNGKSRAWRGPRRGGKSFGRSGGSFSQGGSERPFRGARKKPFRQKQKARK